MSERNKNRKIICPACGSETFLKREPVFDGLKRVGEKLLCAFCGYQFRSEAEVQYKSQKKLSIFDESDKPRQPDVLKDEREIKNCRRCKHYVIHRFAQRCGLTNKEVSATDLCEKFEPGAKTGTSHQEGTTNHHPLQKKEVNDANYQS